MCVSVCSVGRGARREQWAGGGGEICDDHRDSGGRMTGRVNNTGTRARGSDECNIDSPSNRRSITESRSISFCSAILGGVV